MTPMFTFNEESAKTSGAGGISESGAYTGTISSASFTTGRDSQSESMEFGLETDSGKVNYLRVTYLGREGQPLKHGEATINAIMGLTRVKQLNAVEFTNEQGEIELRCRELEGKPIGFVLQKVLYTKTDGSDGYKFEIRQVFGANTRKTFKEASENLAAEAVDKLLETLKERDERVTGAGAANGTQMQRSMLGGGQQQTQQSRLQQVANNRQTNASQHSPEPDDMIPF